MKYAGRPIPPPQGAVGEIATFAAAPNRIIPPYWKFAQHGESGRWMSELLPHLATCADDLAFIHGVKVDNNNHGPAVYHTLTGNQFPGSASIGSWVTYGLGSENQDLPGFVVLGRPPRRHDRGAGVWGNGFLPAAYQGTLFRNGATPIVDLKRPPGRIRLRPAAELDLLRLAQPQAPRRALERRRTRRPDLRLRAGLPHADAGPRSWSISPARRRTTRRLYGFDDPVAEPFGRQCLLARRMVERGVRFVDGPPRRRRRTAGTSTATSGSASPKHCREVDQPVAGLLKDLKARGLLDETLVVWAAEFGRTPFDNNLVTKRPDATTTSTGWPSGWPAAASGRARPSARPTISRSAARSRTSPRARRARDDPAPDGPRPVPALGPACGPLQAVDRHRRPGDRRSPRLMRTRPTAVKIDGCALTFSPREKWPGRPDESHRRYAVVFVCPSISAVL